MDDFEKLPNEPEVEQDVDISNDQNVHENNSVESTDNVNATDNELNEELNNIRDMFQAELDNATQTYLAGGDLQDCDDSADDTDNDSTDENAIDESMLCECCGERERDLSEGEDYPYCSECKDLMRTYPLGFKGVLVFALVLVLGAASLMTNFSKNADIIDKAVTAQAAVANGSLYTGLYTYYDAISAADTDAMPRKLVARCLKVFAKLNDYRDAVTMANQYLDESDLKNPIYKFISEYSIKNETVTAIENIIYEPLSSEETTADDAEGICESLESLKNDSENNYDPYYIDYYKYVVKNTLCGLTDEVYKDLIEIDQTYGDEEWVHLYDLCNAAARFGEIENAQEYFNRIIKENSEDGTAYVYLANAYRFSETPDTEKMLNLAQQGFTAQGTYGFASSDLYRIQAVAYLLDGDNDKAYEAATNMYSVVTQNSYSVTNLFPCLYTYALTCSLTGNDDGYNDIVDLLKTNGYDMSQQVISAINGDITVKELLTDSEGDLA